MRATRDRDDAEQRLKLSVETLSALQKEHTTLLGRTRGMLEGDVTRQAPGPQFVGRTSVFPQGSAEGSMQSSTRGTWRGAGIGDDSAAETSTVLGGDSLTAPSKSSSEEGQYHRLLSAHRRTLQRLVLNHCATGVVATAPAPPSHLLSSGAGADASAIEDDRGASIPVAAMLFGTDMYGNSATATRAAVGAYGNASTAMVSTSGSLPVIDRGSDLDVLRNSGLLDLSGMDLGDDDIAVLVHTLARMPLGVGDGAKKGASNNSVVPGSINAPRPVLAIDLRANRITDVGALLLARLLSAARLPETGGAHHVCSKVRLVDVRGNKISAVGLKALADAVKENKVLGVQHVHMSGAGVVRAIGLRLSNATPALPTMSLSATSPLAAGTLGVVAVVDGRDNGGQSIGDARADAAQLLGAVDALFASTALVTAAGVGPQPSVATLDAYRSESVDDLPGAAAASAAETAMHRSSALSAFGGSSVLSTASRDRFGAGGAGVIGVAGGGMKASWMDASVPHGGGWSDSAPSPATAAAPPASTVRWALPPSPSAPVAAAAATASGSGGAAHGGSIVTDHLQAMAAADEVLNSLNLGSTSGSAHRPRRSDGKKPRERGGSAGPADENGDGELGGTASTAKSKPSKRGKAAAAAAAAATAEQGKFGPSPYAASVRRTESLPAIPPKSR